MTAERESMSKGRIRFRSRRKDHAEWARKSGNDSRAKVAAHVARRKARQDS